MAEFQTGDDAILALVRETGRRVGERLISKKRDKRLAVYPGLASWTDPTSGS